MQTFNRIVLFIPHSSDNLDRTQWTGDIDRAIERWTDWHTDKLFRSDDDRVTSVIFPYSRFYCDAERLIDDPMEKIGQGIAYRFIEGCERVLTDAQIAEIYSKYDSIHASLEDVAKPGSLIIDCHSFPADLAPETDICIGFNEDDTRPQQEIIDMIAGHFREAGHSVEINEPYSNSVCASMDLRKARTKTIMIEINKAVYLDADGITPGKDFDKLKLLIDELYGRLLKRILKSH